MIFERLKTRIIGQVGVEEDEIALESSFVDDLGFDDLDMIELLFEVEEEFDIEIPDSEAEKINTVGEMVQYIQSQKE